MAKVATGRYNTMAITRSGRLYTWGLDKCAPDSPSREKEMDSAAVPSRPLSSGFLPAC